MQRLVSCPDAFDDAAFDHDCVASSRRCGDVSMWRSGAGIVSLSIAKGASWAGRCGDGIGFETCPAFYAVSGDRRETSFYRDDHLG